MKDSEPMLAIPTIKEKGFELSPIPSEETAAFRFSGNGDTAAVGPLDRFLQLLHQELLAKRLKTVSVALDELYFMNSSCLKGFVSWIHNVDTSGKPYEIRLQMNPRLHWQKRSLATLQRLAPEVVRIDERESIPPKG